MDPLSTAASIIAVLQLTSVVTGYIHGSKDATDDRRKLVSELSSMSQILMILQDQLQERLDDLQWSSSLRVLNSEDGPLDQFRDSLEILAHKLEPVKGLARVGKALAWPFQKKEVQEILNSLERQKGLFGLVRQNDHIALSKAILEKNVAVAAAVNTISHDVSQIRIYNSSQITDQNIEKLRQWLKAPDPSSNHNSAIKLRNEGSGNWLLQSHLYQDWLSSPRAFLWLYGKPGCGKTILSSTAIQETLEYCSTRPRAVVAYFYFSFGDVEKQKPEAMLRSAILQLVQSQEISFESLQVSTELDRGQPTTERLLHLLRRILEALDQVFIIIDALDECQDRSELLANLETMVGWKSESLRVLCTSRRETDISATMDIICPTGQMVCIESEIVEADIREYVRHRLAEDPKLKRWRSNSGAKTEIESAIMEKVDGMFRWAACQLDSIEKCLTQQQLRRTLASLPQTLEATYERILLNIDDAYFSYAFKILQWLCFCRHPLDGEAILDITGIDINQTPQYDPERRLQELEDIKTVCSSLIVIVDDTWGGIEIKLAHLSVREYLLSRALQDGKASRYNIQETSAHDSLCLDFLTSLLPPDRTTSKNDTSAKDDISVEDASHLLAFYYAVDFNYHYSELAYNPDAKTHQLLLHFLRANDSAYRGLVHRVYPKGTYGNFKDDTPPPLNYACFRGWYHVVASLLDANSDIDEWTETSEWPYGTALCAASHAGHEAIVQLLLEHGADPNIFHPASNGPSGPALIEACHSRNRTVIQLLLDYGADVNAKDKMGSAALSRLARYWVDPWHKVVRSQENIPILPIARILIEKHASVNTPSKIYREALDIIIDGLIYDKETADLNSTSCLEDTDMLELLIGSGVDLNTLNVYEETPLQRVITYGLCGASIVLLKAGAQVSNEAMKYIISHDILGRPRHYNPKLKARLAAWLAAKGAKVHEQHEPAVQIETLRREINQVYEPWSGDPDCNFDDLKNDAERNLRYLDKKIKLQRTLSTPILHSQWWTDGRQPLDYGQWTDATPVDRPISQRSFSGPAQLSSDPLPS